LPEQNSLSQVASFLSEPAARASLTILAPAIGALLLTACIMPFYIAALKKLQINQFLREEGPKSHSHKAKTPTMGGLVFIITTVSAALLLRL
jgi:phospho-N-acetylmuramoyl-pentapeptide-transferase